MGPIHFTELKKGCTSLHCNSNTLTTVSSRRQEHVSTSQNQLNWNYTQEWLFLLAWMPSDIYKFQVPKPCSKHLWKRLCSFLHGHRWGKLEIIQSCSKSQSNQIILVHTDRQTHTQWLTHTKAVFEKLLNNHVRTQILIIKKYRFKWLTVLKKIELLHLLITIQRHI